MKYKIAFLIGTLDIYGAQQVVYNIIKYLDKKKFEPFLIYWRKGPLLSKFKKIKDLQIFKISQPTYFNLMQTVNDIKHIINEHDISILHSHLDEALLIGKMVKSYIPHIKHITTYHDTKYVPSYLKILFKLLPKVDCAICISRNVSYNKFRDKLIPSIIYNGVEIPKSIKSRKFKKFTLICVGRRIPDKGYPYLLNIISDLSDMNLLVIGDGPYAPKFSNITYLGKRNDIYKWLRKSHAFILLTKKEGLGIANIEAMANGLPVISSNIPGVREVIKDFKTGFLIDYPPNLIYVLTIVLSLMNSQKLREKMGRAGYMLAKQKFNVKAMVKAYEHEYRNL